MPHRAREAVPATGGGSRPAKADPAIAPAPFTQAATRQVAPELIKSQKALDTAKAVADKSNAGPLYQQARTECGGYDTCVTERTDKLRAQKKATTTTTTTRTEQHNQSQKKTQTPDYRSKGGVRASAA
ncbi:hypothetical protein ABT126_44565 [Streptomyces sp. NPDC002012]|uniref:hypothetical protein n=1 Tax=Streptomyces sp. NPDC002012 TaxID=3154532 RepID=UPI0033241228